MPRAAHDARPLAELLGAQGRAGRGEPVVTALGLRGARWRLATGGLAREIVVAAHADYVYALRADGDCAAAVHTVLDSLIPFPAPAGRHDEPFFSHWTT
jgi:hypothetical protein